MCIGSIGTRLPPAVFRCCCSELATSPTFSFIHHRSARRWIPLYPSRHPACTSVQASPKPKPNVSFACSQFYRIVSLPNSPARRWISCDPSRHPACTSVQSSRRHPNKNQASPSLALNSPQFYHCPTVRPDIGSPATPVAKCVGRPKPYLLYGWL